MNDDCWVCALGRGEHPLRHFFTHHHSGSIRHHLLRPVQLHLQFCHSGLADAHSHRGMRCDIVGFGRMISWCEHRWNNGNHRKWKGGMMAVGLIALVFFATFAIVHYLSALWIVAGICLKSVLIFFCLAGTTLIREVKEVFRAADRSLEEGRKQVARIVGRDTSELSAQEIRTAALETLAENLSDGVIAPLFWLAIGGVPGMMAYKMVNTLDSMSGYRTERFRDFGCVAAHIDDIANYVPARLTALLMVLASGRPSLLGFVARYGHCHASPNSGYPEARPGVEHCRHAEGNRRQPSCGNNRRHHCPWHLPLVRTYPRHQGVLHHESLPRSRQDFER